MNPSTCATGTGWERTPWRAGGVGRAEMGQRGE